MKMLIRRSIFLATIVGLVVALVAPALFAQPSGIQEIETKKRGQTGMKFLAMSPDARA